MLRAVQIGLTVADLEYLSFGMLLDLITAHHNDQDEDETREATQTDFDNF